jgi:Ferritin-like domain
MEHSVSRRSFIKKSAVATSAIAVAMASPAALFSQEVVMAQTSDLDVLTFAYTLEVVAVDAYTTAAKSGLLPAAAVAIGTKFAGHHTEHRNALGAAIKQISGKDATAPAGPYNYPQFKSATDILMFAKTLEEAAVGGYYTSVPKLTNAALSRAAASIVGVEASHVAVLASALNMDPIPTAFVVGLPEAEINRIATGLLTKPAGQGGAAPALPATGVGGMSGQTDYTGAVLGLLGSVSAAAAAVLLARRSKSGAGKSMDN